MTIAKKISSSMTQSSMIRKMFEEGILLKKNMGRIKSTISVWEIPTWNNLINLKLSLLN